MHSEALRPGILLGPYPERARLPANKLDEFVYRNLGLWARLPGALRRRAARFVERVNGMAEELRACDARALAEATAQVRLELHRRGLVDDVTARAFAIIREQADRTLQLRHYDSQLIGGFVMLQGMLAEMATGEGKSLAVTLPAATAALAGIPVHVITVNDYLVTRDSASMAPLFSALGLTVGSVTQQMADAGQRRAAYERDVVYCCNKQLVFDYLRDRVAIGQRRGRLHRVLDPVDAGASPTGPLILKGLAFGIVDEADSVLIDECRTPLILSRTGRSPYPDEVYQQALTLADGLREDLHYSVPAGRHAVVLTGVGQAALAESGRALGDFWNASRRREDLVRQALAARQLFRRDEHYIVRDGKVEIVDANTGRIMPDRSWELGLHQMIETKEHCALTAVRESLARITYQSFFSRYLRLAATTGTAREVAGELWSNYGLQVYVVPNHRPSQRQALPTRIHPTVADKHGDIVERVRRLHQMQRPVLIGTRSVGVSEQLSELLTAAGLTHHLLNARQDAQEANIVVLAGRAGAITIATNMAGRGTDIKLGSGVAVVGGLHVFVTEQNDSRRVDRQLVGRCGRQGDPGSHEAVLSLQDELVAGVLPASLLRVARLLYRTSPRYAPQFAQSLLRIAQRITEHRHATGRRLLLSQDDRLGDTLAFSGSLE